MAQNNFFPGCSWSQAWILICFKNADKFFGQIDADERPTENTLGQSAQPKHQIASFRRNGHS